jgi:hypothetical protein
MQSVRPQFDQPNWNCRPSPDIHRLEFIDAQQLLAQHADRRPRRVDTGTPAAHLCMNSSGDGTKCVVPSRQSVFGLDTTSPAALSSTRSLASAGRAMQRHGRSRPC